MRAHDRRRAAGGGARPADDRPRAAPAPGDAPRHPAARRHAAGATALLDRVGLTARRRPPRRHLLGRHARRLDLAAALVHTPRGALPRRADDGARPGQPQGDLGGGRRAQRRRARRSSSPPSTWRRPTSSPTASGSSTAASSSPRGRRRPLKAEVGRPHLELSLVEQQGKESPGRGDPGALRASAARPGRNADGRARARRRRDRRRSCVALDQAGLDGRVARPRPAHARRRLRRRRPASTWRAHPRTRTRAEAVTRVIATLAANARVVGRAGQALDHADAPAAAAARAAHRLPHRAPGDPDRRAPGGRSTCPGSRTSPNFLSFMLAGSIVQSVMFTGNSGAIAFAIDMEMGFTDRLYAAPISRSSVVLGRLGGHRDARGDHRRLLHRARADLRREHPRGRARRSSGSSC